MLLAAKMNVIICANPNDLDSISPQPITRIPSNIIRF